MPTLTKEQQSVIDFKGSNILVSASAGSGKTFVMIERIIKLIIENKASVSSILAVTFTKSAASEMKEKLTEALIKKINEDDNERLKKELKSISQSDICTIHSFCGNLLRAYFFEADVDANFEILDSQDSKILQKKAVNELFEEKYLTADTDFLTTIKEFLKFRKDDELKNIIITIYNQIMSFEKPFDALSSSFKYADSDGFNYILQQIKLTYSKKLEIILLGFKQIYDDIKGLNYPIEIEYLKTFIDTILLKINETDYYKYIQLNNLFNFSKPIRIKEDSEIFKELNDLKAYRASLKKLTLDEEKFISNRENDLEKYLKSFETAKRLYKLVYDFSVNYSNIKNKEGKLDFNDLEHKTLNLLSNPDVLNNIKEKYNYIFADEYQDVNSVQEKILELLSKNNLFMVGDLKQSIYGFRGCNPEFFKNKYLSFSSGYGAAINLNKNFRSSDGVISFVNNIFSKAITQNTAGINYYNNSKLIFGELYPKNKGQAEVHTLDFPNEKENFVPKIYDIYEDLQQDKKKKLNAEHEIIAEIITDQIGKEYYDIKSNSYQKIDYKDIVVLSSATTHFQELTKVLYDKNIPVSSQNKNNILDYPEIKFFIDLLNIIDCKEQDIPLISCLKIIGELDENQLSQIRLNGEKDTLLNLKNINFRDCITFYINNFDDEITAKLKNFNKYLDKLRLIAEFKSANEILETVIFEKNLNLYFTLQENGELKQKRILRFIRESILGSKKLSVKEFLTRLNKLTEPITLSEFSSENNVTLMTIHKSKGLEFPVVILAGVSSIFNLMNEKESVFISEKYGLITKYYNLDTMLESQTIFRKLIKNEYRNAMIKEQLWLFYVALTRAKYNLFLVANKKEPNVFNELNVLDATSFSDFLDFENIKTVNHTTLNDDLLKEKQNKNIIFSRYDENIKNIIYNSLNFKYKDIEATILPQKTNVSLLNTTPNEYYATTNLFGESNSEKGTAYHKYLQNCNFDKTSLENIKNQLHTFLTNGLMTQEQLLLIDTKKLYDIVNMDIFKFIKDKQLFKEQEFLIKIPANIIYENYTSKEKVLVQGIIDLLAIDKTDKTIGYLFDYKYSTIKFDDDLIKKYRKQLEIYKYATEHILNISIKKMSIINILSNKVINID